MNKSIKIALFGIGSFILFGFKKSKNSFKILENLRLRNCDLAGCGYYHASRIRNGVSVEGAHNGLDILVTPGENVFAPIDGKVRIFNAYNGTNEIKGVEITKDAIKIKIFYVKSNLKTGQYIKSDDVIGFAQDIAAYYNSKSMQPHLHVEIYENGVNVNPTKYFV